MSLSSAKNIVAIGDLGDRIEIKLLEVNSGLARISSILEGGFAAIEFQLIGIQDAVNRTAEAVENPDRTWAWEQYSSAKLCFSRELWNESLEYLEMAIGGDGRRNGYRIESEFHFLQGKLFSGYGTSGTSPIFDLRRAINSFELCTKYSRKSNLKLASKSMREAGWAYYCLGELDTAVRCYQGSIEIQGENADAKFLMAKCFCAMNSKELARGHFLESAKENSLYAWRALNDNDFSTVNIHGWIEDVRKATASEAERLIPRLTDFEASEVARIGVEYGASGIKKQASDLREKIEKTSQLGLFEIKPHIFGLVENEIEELKSKLSKIESSINNNLSKASQRANREEKNIKEKDYDAVGILAGGIVYVSANAYILLVTMEGWQSLRNASSFWEAIFLVIITLPISAAIIFFCTLFTGPAAVFAYLVFKFFAKGKYEDELLQKSGKNLKDRKKINQDLGVVNGIREAFSRRVVEYQILNTMKR